MDRTDFYNIVTIRGIQEYDFLQNNLSNFVMNYPVTYYRVVSEDVGRLDLISFKVYNTVDYWWLIGYVNSVENVFVDINVGDVYIIPNLQDVYQFYKSFAVNTTSSGSSTGPDAYGNGT